MTGAINFNAKDVIQSASPLGPFTVIYQSDSDLTVVYAVVSSSDDLCIVDQVELDLSLEVYDVVIRWNATGDRAAILLDERIHMVFDFKAQLTFTTQLAPSLPTAWLRQAFEFSTALAVEFGVDEFFKQPELDHAIDVLKQDESQTHRLLFYKALLTSKLFVPITTDDPGDPNALIYTFPNESNDLIDAGDLVCSFTDSVTFQDQMGQYGLGAQKISADFLCFQVQSFPNILGITITSRSGHTVLITRNEFQLLAMISQPQRLDAKSLLKEMGQVFFDDLFDEHRTRVADMYQSQFAVVPLVRAGYYCQPSVDGAKPLFCLVLKSTNASDELTQLVQTLQQSDAQSFCDCHVFSLSDIVAQALEASKQSL